MVRVRAPLLMKAFVIFLVFIQVSDDSKNVDYTAAAFHPDGLILGTGTSQSVVKIWDVKSQVKTMGFQTI